MPNDAKVGNEGLESSRVLALLLAVQVLPKQAASQPACQGIRVGTLFHTNIYMTAELFWAPMLKQHIL